MFPRLEANKNSIFLPHNNQVELEGFMIVVDKQLVYPSRSRLLDSLR